MSIVINEDASLPVGGEGGGGGAVDSVNGQTGVVVLTAADVSAIPTSDKGTTTGKVPTINGGLILGVMNWGFSSINYTSMTGVYQNFIAGGVTTFSSVTSLSTAYDNCAIGFGSLKSFRGGQGNIAIGAEALYNFEGSLSSTSYDIFNTVVGYNAARGMKYGFRNTIIGARAVANGSSTYQLSNSVVIGQEALLNLSLDLDNISVVGNGASVTGSNQVQLGNSSTTTYTYGAVQDRSDARDKTDIQPSNLGLDFLLALQPSMWKWNYRESYLPDLFPALNEADFANADAFNAALEQQNIQKRAWLSSPTNNTGKERQRYHHGLIAQDVKAILEQQNIDWGGFQDHSVNGGEDVLSIGYVELIAPLISAVKQLHERLEALENT